MSDRKLRFPRCALALAILALCWGGLLLTAEVVAQCTQGCSTTDSGQCQGASSGQCDSCAQSLMGGPAQCGSYGGITTFKGTKIFGSTTGNGNVTFFRVSCKVTTPCLNSFLQQGGCVFGQFGGFSCSVQGIGGCQTCTSGAPVASSWAQQCQSASCPGS